MLGPMLTRGLFSRHSLLWGPLDFLNLAIVATDITEQSQLVLPCDLRGLCGEFLFAARAAPVHGGLE